MRKSFELAVVPEVQNFRVFGNTFCVFLDILDPEYWSALPVPPWTTFRLQTLHHWYYTTGILILETLLSPSQTILENKVLQLLSI